MAGNDEMLHFWNEVVGAKWVANQARLDRLMAPLTDALLAAAAPLPGELVVDVGCGCGETTLRVAAVGGSGYIRAIDLSRPMLTHAAARAAGLIGDLAHIQWIAADAARYPFPPVSTLVLSRFGVMFFDDRPAAFANLRSALIEGGRFVFLCWRAREQNAWFQCPLDWIAPVLPTPDEPRSDVGPFALADAPSTIAQLVTAGFVDVTAEQIDCPLVVVQGADDAQAVEEAVQLLADTGPAASLLREAEPGQRDAALALLRRAVAARAQDGRVLLGGACWLYRGRA